MQPEDPDHAVKHVDYQSLNPPKLMTTRAIAASECGCSICVTGRMSFIEYTEYKKAVSNSVGRTPSTN